MALRIEARRKPLCTPLKAVVWQQYTTKDSSSRFWPGCCTEGAPEEPFRHFLFAHHKKAKVMKAYSPPVLSNYGSIVDCTFATPARGGDPNETDFNTSTPGVFTCGPTAGLYSTGGKSQQVLLCDKFGEYSHPADNTTTQSVS